MEETSGDIIFSEKIRHPSNTEAWITARDYYITNQKAEENFTTKTGTISSFTAAAHTYNFESATVTINDTTYSYAIPASIINNSAINVADINPSPTTTPTSTLLGDIVITSSIEPIDMDVTISDILGSQTVSAVYDYTLDNSQETRTIYLEDITILPTIAEITSSTTVSNYITEGDIIVVPEFNDNDSSLSLASYECIGIPENETIMVDGEEITAPSPQSQDNFEWNISDTDNSVLNIIRSTTTSTTNDYITLVDDLLGSATLQTTNTINITSIDDEYVITNSNGTLYNKIYGNGTILNRYNISGTYNYQWIICNDNSNNYLINFNSENSSIINWYQVTVASDGTITQTIITPTSMSLYIGWHNNTLIDFINNKHLKPLEYIYYNNNDITTISITNKYYSNNYKKAWYLKTNDISIGNIVVDTPTIETPIEESLNISILTNNNNKIVSSSTLEHLEYIDNSNNIFKYYTGNINQNVGMFTIQYTSDDNNPTLTWTFNEIYGSNNSLSLYSNLFDALIIAEPTVPIEDIYFKVFMNTMSGTITYGKTINNPYYLKQKDTATNVIYGNNINNFWSHLIFNTNNINTLLDTSKIYITYNDETGQGKGIISYGTRINNNPTLIQLNNNPYNARIWFIQNGIASEEIDADVTKTTEANIYVIDQTKITLHDNFINLIAEPYTAVILSASNINLAISYNWHEFQKTIRYYGADGKLLNVGDEYTPVYIKNGQFYPCIGLNDVEISSDQPERDTEIWINPNS